MNKKEKPINIDGVIGTWTGVAIFMVIMTAFGWWYVWWAYIALIGIISGAIQQTVAYVQKKKSKTEPNTQTLTSNEPIQTEERNQIAYCPGCGQKIESNIAQCPTCGYEIK